MKTTKSKATGSKAATGRKEKSFKPIVFGGKNVVKERIVIQYYQDLVSILNSIIESVNSILFDTRHPFEFEFIFGLLQQKNIKDKRRFIFTKYVSLNSICIPGIDTQQLIDKEMLELKISEELMNSLTAFETAILNFEIKRIGFAYPLRKLYKQINNDAGVFFVGEDFSRSLEKFYMMETSTPAQNEIYNSLEVIANNLNNLHGMGVLHVNKLDQFLDLTIETDRFKNENPFGVSSNTFKRNFLKEHRIFHEDSLPIEYMFL
jgi:hypothetical protein